MPAKDLFHNLVITALIKEGWTITHDPFPISIGGVDMAIDLGAERVIAAKKGNQKIAVEIKSFLQKSSAIYEFHLALGQFINYRQALKYEDAERILYLAVPILAYNSFFMLEFIQEMIKINQLKLIVYDIEQESIVLWKN